jgi:metal-responsive CopG/Arc/MetJ family transcriptional regulator
MKNVQISFDEDLLEKVDELAASSERSRSAVVREATKEWVRQQAVKNFERQWIAKLTETPQDLGEADAWAEVESWSDE